MDQLAEAVRRALKDDAGMGQAHRARREWERLAAIATDAQWLTEKARDALSDGAGGPRTERRLIVGALLVHALDIAWATCHMLRTEPKRTHVVALTLWRPLLEHWLRAAFFTLEASDDEVTAFRTAGTIPMRVYPSQPNNPVQINIKLIALLVGPRFSPSAPELFTHLAKEEDWHGFVHGGDVVVRLLDSGETFESQISADDVMRKVQRIAIIACLCGSTGVMLSRRERDEAELRKIEATLGIELERFLTKWPSSPQSTGG